MYNLRVNREDIEELHYIVPIENVLSICRLGILSKNRAKASGLKPASVAMQEIQDLREKKVVPGGRPLHDYANLYICARNPMLYKRRGQHLEICVLRVRPEVLDLPRVVITDANASAKEVHVRFAPAPAGLEIVDESLTFAKYWTDTNEAVGWRKKSAKCAEVLVPDRVPPKFLAGAYVSCGESLMRFGLLKAPIAAVINRDLFFYVE